MKRKLLSIFALTVMGGLLINFSSCTKDDSGAPIVTLKGDKVMSVDFGGTFTDPGATATDDVDKTPTVVVDGTVNVNAAGEYTLTYKSTDAAGNVGSETRTVNVVHRNADIAGIYSVTESFTSNNPDETSGNYGPFSATITSGAGNMALQISNFGDYGASTIVTATITGAAGLTLTIPSVTVTGLTIEGSGTINASGSAISINYTANDGTFLYHYTDTWTAQ